MQNNRMDSINSWINEEEVRKLAEELTSAPQEESKQDEVNEASTDDFSEVSDAEAVIKPVGTQPIGVVKPRTGSIEDFLKEKTDVSEDGSVRIPNEVKAEKALSLAKASAMAESIGLIKAKGLEKSTQSISAKGKTEAVSAEATKLCDNFLNV